MQSIAGRNPNPFVQRAPVRVTFRVYRRANARKAARYRLGNNVREAGAGGSNPLSPTIFPPVLREAPASCSCYRPRYVAMLRVRSADVPAQGIPTRSAETACPARSMMGSPVAEGHAPEHYRLDALTAEIARRNLDI
jgi:hypothetical protein